MPSPEPIYPAKRTLSPGGDFAIRQFFLPICLNGQEVWALLDTGAHISILPKEISGKLLTTYDKPIKSGKYPLAGLLEVPYESYELDFQIFEHINNTISPEMNILPYSDHPEINVNMRDVEFQVPTLTWPEIASKVHPEEPLSVESRELDYVILGLYGVLDQLTFSFVGGNSVTVSSISPE